MSADARWIARGEALDRLGIKTQTLYAYVSRGRIAARPDPANPRRSLYALDDIARLSQADAQAPSGPRAPVLGAAARGEADLASSVSLIAEGRLFYRGRDAAVLAETASIEQVARLLWDAEDADPFAGLKPRIDPIVGGATQRRILAVLGRRAIEDRSLNAHDADSLRREAASLLSEVVDSVSGPGPRLYLHQRLARGFKTPDRDAHLIRRAVALGADAGLDAAVLATRAAASGGAPLAGAVLAGMTTLTGATLARMTEAAAYVSEARRDAAGAAQRWIGLGGGLPGFGGDDFGRTDPRARVLLIRADLPADLAAAAAEGEAASRRAPGFAAALALVARKLDLGPSGAGDLLMLGRMVGLIAHALDQATDGSPIRARLRYVGPEPTAS